MKMRFEKITLRFNTLAIAFCILVPFSRALATPDTGCQEGGPYWFSVTPPYLADYFTVPEPGLTNEPMTIPGSAFLSDGTRGESFDCSGTISPLDWPVGGAMNWSSQFVPSLETISGETGTSSFSSGSSASTISATITPTQAGDQAVSINVEAVCVDPIYTGTETDNPFIVPITVYPRQRLTYLSFNNDFLAGQNGALPLTADNVTLVPSPFGQGINFNSGSSISLVYPAFLNDGFPVSEVDGSLLYSTGTPNIRKNEGTVRFWFMPEWSSGHGPSNGGVFFNMLYGGASTWSLIITNNGTTIQLAGPGSSLSSTVNLISNQWYQIAATYSTTQTALYTNGVLVGSAGSGFTASPYVTIDSFAIGSDGASAQVRGIMDEVETFNYSQSSTNLFSAYTNAIAIDADGDGVPDIQEFEMGIDPASPSGGNPYAGIPPAPTGSPNPPAIQLIVPINAIPH